MTFLRKLKSRNINRSVTLDSGQAKSLVGEFKGMLFLFARNCSWPSEWFCLFLQYISKLTNFTKCCECLVIFTTGKLKLIYLKLLSAQESLKQEAWSTVLKMQCNGFQVVLWRNMMILRHLLAWSSQRDGQKLWESFPKKQLSNHCLSFIAVCCWHGGRCWVCSRACSQSIAGGTIAK